MGMISFRDKKPATVEAKPVDKVVETELVKPEPKPEAKTKVAEKPVKKVTKKVK